MTLPSIIIASAHHRNNHLEHNLSQKLSSYKVVRIGSRDDLSLELLEQLQPEFIFFPHWSWLIPETIHNNYQCIIFHMTDLPYGRGGSPLQNLIVKGHTETQLSAIRCVQELDAGPVYIKQPLSLIGSAEEILTRASHLMEAMIINIVINRLNPVPQKGSPTLFKRRKKDDGDLSRLNDFKEVYDYIRMLDADGYPQAFIEKGDFRFEFNQATLHNESIEAKVRIIRRKKSC